MKVSPVFWLLPFVVSSERLSLLENSKLQEECGLTPVSNAPVRRSMHTEEISRAIAPWAVRLEYTKQWFPNMTMEDRENQSAVICSGSLISSRHVLTAAHCIHMGKEIETTCNDQGDVLTTNYGKVNIDRITARIIENSKYSEHGLKDVHIAVQKIFMSKDYTTINCPGSDMLIRGDVAVIELAEDVKFSKIVYPACLNDRDIEDGEPLQLAGYGFSLNATHGFSRDTELDVLRIFNSFMATCLEKATDDVKCTYNEFASTCMGDSGAGHFYIDDHGRARIVAPLSGGSSCSELLEVQKQRPVSSRDYSTLIKPNLLWICAATGICLGENSISYYNVYNAKGLAESWYKTFEKLSGYDVYV